MKDFLGKEVAVGDKIYYSTTGRYAESRLCEITRFTKKSVFARIIKTNRPGDFQYGEEVIVRNDFAKVEV